MNVNYKREYFFKLKFGRNPKEWSIEELHILYLRAKNRFTIHCKKVSDVTNRIINETENAQLYINKETRVIYHQKNDKLYKRVFSYLSEYDTWGISSREEVKFNGKNPSEIRNEKLNFLISCDKKLELGELYEKLDKNKYFHQGIHQLLSEKVNDKLNKKFKGIKAPNFFTITINEKQYIIECDREFMYNKNYKRFYLKNEVEHFEL